VASPDHSPNSWAQLAHALEGFNPELRKMMQVKEQRFFEEESAKGAQIESMQENAKTWAEYTKEHPEHEGLNPHLERGYKAAHLRRKARDFENLLREKAFEEGWANETDTGKVQERLAATRQAFETANLNPADYDALLMRDNYLPLMEQAEKSFMERNTGLREKEHLARAEQAFGQEFEEGLSDLLSGADFKNPAVMADLSAQAIAFTTATRDRAIASGMSESRANAVLVENTFRLARAEGEEGYGDEYLEMAKEIPVGNGKMGNLPVYGDG
jgi:hypothetical protein